MLISGIISCHEEEDISMASSLLLEFSADTVEFDTLLTSRNSITKRFRIFNTNNKAIRISEIALGRGTSSPYQLTVNGKNGKGITDEVVMGGDSLLVLVTVTIDPSDESTPFLVKDSIITRWNGNQADIKLVSWGQNANYLEGPVLCDETWTSEKPYVLIKDVLVDSLCTLTIEKGTKIYLDNGIRMLVQGSLIVEGDSGQHVIFRNSRFDENYIEAPGQWDGIYFLEGSRSEISYATVENARVGLRIGTPDNDTIPDLTVRNTIIRHMSETAVQAFTSDVYFENCLLYNAGESLVFHAAGGNYYYDHCTLVNTPNFFFQDVSSFVFADNIVLSNNETLVEDLTVRVRNSILWDEGEQEILFSVTEESNSQLAFSRNIIYGFSGLTGNTVSSEKNFPGFADPNLFEYRLDSLSPAIDAGIPGISDLDLEGHPRDALPDIGAFERIR